MSDGDTPLPLFETLGNPSIVVVGDLMLDEYICGSVSRISPESPVPVVRGALTEHRSGGAGSVVENLAVLGADVQIIAVLGDDDAGETLRSILETRTRDTSGLVVTKGRPTTRKSRVIASVQQAHRGQQQLCRIDWEDTSPLPADVEKSIIERIRTAIEARPRAVLVSDYEKGLLSERVMRSLIDCARDHDVPVLVDPGRSGSYDRYRGATLLCPNRFEAESATGVSLSREEGFHRACEILLTDLELEHAVLTLDREGIFLGTRSGLRRKFETVARSVADVAGAGDMVLSLLGLALGAGWSIEHAIQLANLGAGLEVQKFGVSPVEPWELEHALRSRRDEFTPSKVRSTSELRRILERERAAGRSVVFTNGCFDLLHVGHIKILERAKAFGDLLVVGLNSDASIRRLKGEERPIVGEEQRALVLSALGAVDHIVFFDDDTPLAVIEALLPDVLVKGADYAVEDVVGREVVEASGGRVELVRLHPEISTSSIVERIRQAEERERDL